MEKRIFYVGYYDSEQNKDENRYYALSAANKMTYISSAINKNGYDVEIVSASRTNNNCNYSAKEYKIFSHTKIKLFKTEAYTRNLLSRILNRVKFSLRFYGYLFLNVRKNDKVLIYHSLGYAIGICLLKAIKKFHLILEVEEIYSDVTGNENTRKLENKIFKAADAYLFSTELLNEKINKLNKPFAIIYGTYQVEKDRKCKFHNGKFHEKINCLYAGTLDIRKGGAVAATAAAERLPSGYHIHILGFGNEEEKKMIQEEVEKVANKTEAGISYDGTFNGEEYIHFVQCCQIGLSTQMPDAAFNDTSFPSKVLSYLANGLRVVSIRLKVLEKSEIGDLLYYYDKQTPEAIAEAIQEIDFTQEYDSRKRIQKLDTEFIRKIGELLYEKR